MSVEENLHIDREAMATMDARDWGHFDQLHAESVVVHSPRTPEPTEGRAAHRESVQGLTTAFPDIRFKEKRSFGQGDWVCGVYVATGTHKGPLEGPGGQTIACTNKPVRLTISHVARIEGGEIAEEHNFFDRLEMMAQLGLVP